MKFVTQYSYVKTEGKKFKKPSQTIPDMSFTIKQLLTNYTRLPDIIRPALYDDNPDIDNPLSAHNDLTDLDEAKHKVYAFRKRLKSEIAESKKEKEV